MTLFQMVESAQAEIATLQATVSALQPSDPTAAIASAIKPVEDQLSALAELVGTPSAPPAA